MRAYRNVVRVALAGLLPLIASLQFLTRLPLPVRLPDSEAIFRRSTAFYPAAGLLIGLLAAGAGYGLSAIFPFYIVAVLVLGLWVFLTGGLHLDGLMDTADGLLSYRSRERMLEIMKDSRVGAMGVIVCVLYLMMKMMLLAGLFAGIGTDGIAGAGPMANSDLVYGEASVAMAGGVGVKAGAGLHATGSWLALFALLPVWSRAFLPAAIAFWPYARSGGAGLGQLFRSVRARHAAAAFALAVGLSLLVLRMSGGFSWQDALLWCAVLAAATYGAGGLGASLVSRKLGGLTGDVYGALNEAIELALLLGLVAYEFRLG